MRYVPSSGILISFRLTRIFLYDRILVFEDIVNTLTQAYLKQRLGYDKETGVFTWIATNKIAGTTNKSGYRQISIDNKLYYAHRLTWLYCFGMFPTNQIDHVNRIKNDNRLCNLRECFQTQNNYNQKIKSTNVSGYKGVHFEKKSNKFLAYIVLDKKMIRLGLYATAEHAAVVRMAAEFELAREFFS